MNKSLSQTWAERLRKTIPWGSSTGAKIPRYLPEDPGVMVRGEGCRVWDADGREYIDYICALGPVTLGYRYPAVDAAIREQLESGIAFGRPHPLEGEVAELLCEAIPCAERVRFLKTGGEALAACNLLARYHTGRDHIVQIGYNGWLNTLAYGAQPLPHLPPEKIRPGVPAALAALHHVYSWNDTDGLTAFFKRRGSDVAALVVAARYADMEHGASFYPFLREVTERHGSLLIFDEIVTGFRVALAGVQEHFGITPDLSVFAKGCANGMPLSAYCGRAGIMDKLDKAIVSSTGAGETLSLAAARATLQTYRRQDVIGHIWRAGEKLGHGLNALFERYGHPARYVGLPPCQALAVAPEAPPEWADNYYRAAFRNGVSLFGVLYPNYSHRDSDLNETLKRMESAVSSLRS